MLSRNYSVSKLHRIRIRTISGKCNFFFILSYLFHDSDCEWHPMARCGYVISCVLDDCCLPVSQIKIQPLVGGFKLERKIQKIFSFFECDFSDRIITSSVEELLFWLEAVKYFGFVSVFIFDILKFLPQGFQFLVKNFSFIDIPEFFDKDRFLDSFQKRWFDSDNKLKQLEFPFIFVVGCNWDLFSGSFQGQNQCLSSNFFQLELLFSKLYSLIRIDHADAQLFAVDWIYANLILIKSEDLFVALNCHQRK